MAENEIPDDVRGFVIQHVDSVPVLEAIITLNQNRDEEWDTAKAGARLYVSEAMAGVILAQLAAQGIFSERESDGRRLYRYRPGAGGLGGLVDRLVEVYARALIPLTRLIHSKPSASVRDFADAFRLRKGE